MDTSSHDRVTKETKTHLMKYLSWMMTRWFRRFHLQERECRLHCCRRSLLGRLYLKMAHIKLSILLTPTLLRDKINEGNVMVTAPSDPSGQSPFLPLGAKRYSESKMTCLRTQKLWAQPKPALLDPLRYHASLWNVTFTGSGYPFACTVSLKNKLPPLRESKISSRVTRLSSWETRLSYRETTHARKTRHARDSF